MIGQRIGNYEVTAKLGEGAMGSVWKALDLDLERPVALKLMNAALSENPDLQARFRAEARTQAHLSHHNVARLYALLTWEGKAAMVMEYVEGQTVHDLIVKGGPLPPATAVALCKQALCGVGAAHEQGIVHRDLKPANLILNTEGVIKVMDFGIAKIKGGAGLTRTSMQMGTYYYMSPEQVMGKDVDGRTDIYAMGVTLYEMLTGSVPFNFDSDYAIQSAHVQQAPESPCVRNPRIPQSLASVVMRALEKDPAARFGSTEEFIRAFPRGNEASQPTPPPMFTGSGTVMEAPVFINTRPAGAGAVASLGAAPAAPVASAPVPAAPVAEMTGQGSRGKNRGMLLGAVAVAVMAAVLGAVWMMGRPKHAEPVENTSSNATSAPAAPSVTSPQPAKPQPGPTSSTAPKKMPTDAKLKPVQPNPSVTPVKLPPKPEPVKPPDEVIRQPVPASSEAGFAGQWTGTYQDSLKQQSTKVTFALHGSEKQVSGGMDFTTADNETGHCTVSSKPYDAQSRQLTLLITGCSGGAPVYFHLPTTFSNATPEGRVLSGGKVYAQPNVTAVLAKRGM